MAVPSVLLKQLLALDEEERVEIAQALLSSVEDHGQMSAPDREKLHAAIQQSLAEIEAGETVPFDAVIASLRAKRTRRSAQ